MFKLSALDNLSSALREKIENRPTFTILRNTSSNTEIQFDTMPKAKLGMRDISIPDSFDGRKVWKGLLTPVKNQGNCSSCWAFSSSSTLADRFNIQSMGKLHIDLSPTKMILCDFMGKELTVMHPETDPEEMAEINVESLGKGACKGDTLYDAWRYLYVIGTCTESCIPYNSILGGEFKFDSLSKFSKDSKLPLCLNVAGPIGDMCADTYIDAFSGEEFGTPAQFFRCYHFYSIAGTKEDGGSELYIRHNIYCWGPVSTGMIVYPDFYIFDPKTQIYEWNGYGEPVGGHAIEIVGWGEEPVGGQVKKYWIVRNSWGSEWGREGYFYMARGNNNCKLEENIIAGVPDFFYPDNYIIDNNSFVWAETPKIREQRHEIDTRLTISGGGIDSTMGYTRRVLSTKPWINFTPLIKPGELPEWKTFIAAINSSEKNRWKGKPNNLLENISPDKKENSIYLYLLIAILTVLIPTFFYVFLMYRKK